MAWMACHLFVECSEQARVQGPLTELLRDPSKRADLEGLVAPPGPVHISPAHEGWIAVTGAGAWIADLRAAAAHLARACNARAVSLELFANCYRLRLSEHQGGEQRRALLAPEDGWDTEEEPPRMPLYEDTEQLAWTTLAEIGVPPALAAIGTAPLGSAAKEPALSGQAVTLTPTLDGDAVEEGTCELTLPGFGGDDAPVLPNGLTQDFGTALFEDRYVEGAPGAETLARLLEIEQWMLERSTRACPPEARVSLTVTYHDGVHQDRLDDMLRAEGHHTQPASGRERAPWWAFWRYLGKMR
jgi:hypothetical protein